MTQPYLPDPDDALEPKSKEHVLDWRNRTGIPYAEPTGFLTTQNTPKATGKDLSRGQRAFLWFILFAVLFITGPLIVRFIAWIADFWEAALQTF